jgi:glutaminyl-tRNA synthetase
LVDEGLVSGWDDPRLPTLAGMRRRGYTAAALRNFCESVGVARSESQVDLAMLEHSLREDLDANAPRAMCVLRPLRVTLTNIDEPLELSLPNHPKKEEMGRRAVPLTKEIVIDREDFRAELEPGFKRLVVGGEVRLRGAYVIRCDEVLRDANGEISELICSADLNTLGKNPEGRKVKGVIHWVSATQGISVDVRLYDRLFTIENPEAREVEDFTQHLNSDSLQQLSGCMIEPAAARPDAAQSFQFEREGYFTRDSEDSTGDVLVFNQTISLRASH